MKLGFLLATGARASFIESFELIPDGYHGTYQNWNVTQLLVENEDDELFQAFEEEVNYIEENYIEEMNYIGDIKLEFHIYCGMIPLVSTTYENDS